LCLDDPMHELDGHDVSVVKLDENGSVDVMEDIAHVPETERFSFGR